LSVPDHFQTRSESVRRGTRRRLVSAARSGLSFTGKVTPNLVDDVCKQTGLHPSAFRTFFPSEEALLDAVYEALVEECAAQLQIGVDQFIPVGNEAADLVEAAFVLARARPLDRGGLIIRAHRRLNGLRNPGRADSVVQAEKRFLVELVGILVELMIKTGRRFVWQELLAARVIVDTYERSFEAWMLAGHDEHHFHESDYIRRTLPVLFAELTDSVLT